MSVCFVCHFYLINLFILSQVAVWQLIFKSNLIWFDFIDDLKTSHFTTNRKIDCGAENAGVKNASEKTAREDSIGGNCRSGKYGSGKSMENRQNRIENFLPDLWIVAKNFCSARQLLGSRDSKFLPFQLLKTVTLHFNTTSTFSHFCFYSRHAIYSYIFQF